MEELPEQLQDLVQERTLSVEVALQVALHQERNGNDRYRCILQEIAVEFASGLPTLSLTTSIDYLDRCPPYPGVYLIYYVGETSLYGTLVKRNRDRPIYVGMSRSDILDRLRVHWRRIEGAEDLESGDFVVRFMIVDINHYAPSIEGLLIEFYNPLWNDKKVNFNFGNANAKKNNWKKYHVSRNKSTKAKMIKLVRNNYQER